MKNMSEYREMNRDLVFETNSLFSQINYIINSQFELDLRNDWSGDVVDSRIRRDAFVTTSKTPSNVKKQINAFKAASTVVDVLVLHLNHTFKTMHFESMLTEVGKENINFEELISCADICVSNKYCNTVTHDEMKSFRKETINLLTEINDHITTINEATKNSDIKSVILCKNKNLKKYLNPITYNQYYAALFTYNYFNCSKDLAELNLSFILDENTLNLNLANRVENTTMLKKEIYVSGTLSIDVPRLRTFGLSGKYIDDNLSSSVPFKRIVRCLEDEEISNIDKLYESLLNAGSEEVTVILCPMQNYVCLEGHSAKTYKIMSVNKNK